MTLQLLSELDAVIRAHRERTGYDLVLRVDRTEPSGLAAEFRERLFRAQTNNVVDFADALDITAAVLAELNAPEHLARRRRGE